MTSPGPTGVVMTTVTFTVVAGGAATVCFAAGQFAAGTITLGLVVLHWGCARAGAWWARRMAPCPCGCVGTASPDHVRRQVLMRPAPGNIDFHLMMSAAGAGDLAALTAGDGDQGDTAGAR